MIDMHKGWINPFGNGGSTRIMHPIGLIIGATHIGENCVIRQNVSIGHKNNSRYPYIGNDVEIGAGCIIVGDVKVGANAIVGAGAIVIKDVSPCSSC